MSRFMSRFNSVGLLAAGLCFAAPALSQTYPVKPVRTIMTIAGGADVVARLVAQGLTESFGQPFIVEAQAGPGGAVGAEMVMRAPPDGHVIMLAGIRCHDPEQSGDHGKAHQGRENRTGVSCGARRAVGRAISL